MTSAKQVEKLMKNNSPYTRRKSCPLQKRDNILKKFWLILLFKEGEGRDTYSKHIGICFLEKIWVGGGAEIWTPPA